MKPIASSYYLHITLVFLAHTVTSQKCQQDSALADFPYENCTKANTAFCEGGTGSTIILRCFYPYGYACPGNCMDNLDEQYRDAACWESAPGAGDGQCAAQCVSVIAKNGTTFYPFGCSEGSASSITSPISTTTSVASTSTTPLSPAATTTSQQSSGSATAKSDSNRHLSGYGVAFGMGCLLNLAAFLVN